MAEAVGLALAVVPLLTSAASGYSATTNALRRYRHFSDEVGELFAELNVQCTIFRSSVQMLLASFVGDEQATEMIKDEHHRGWVDSDLESLMGDRFEHCFSALMDSVSLIRNRLVSIQRLTSSFHAIVEETNKDEAISNRIESLMRNLKERTQDFRILVQQSETLANRKGPELPNVSTRKALARFTAVKSAAENLYAAFGKACTKHIEHQGYLGLQPVYNERDRINFVLALKGIQPVRNVPSSSKVDDVVWMSVESTINGTVHAQRATSLLESMKSTSKRARETKSPSPDALIDTESTDKKKGKKTVSFQLDLAKPLLRQSTSTLSSQPLSTDILTNLCIHNSFCNVVRSIFREPRLTGNRCVGYLETCKDSKHLVYINSRSDTIVPSTQTSDMVKLSDLLAKLSVTKHPDEQLCEQDQFRIGKQLATAVLQFQDTHWLKELWSSDDVVVPNLKTASMESENSYARPVYANVSIRGQDQSIQPAQKQFLPFVRNRALFNLGKLLLELAYQRPFNQLKKDEDQGFGAESNWEYFTAKRLLCSVSAELGTKYSELVRKCIECDFGQGDDLKQEKLQASFYQHVIGELEQCEQQVA